MSQIFISYAEEDAAVAQEIARTLENSGISSWYYQRDNRSPGPSYTTEILEAIERCQAMVAVISPHLIASQHADLEFHKAYELDKRIIPILRGISHDGFQAQKPEWEAMLRGSTTIQVRGKGAKSVLPDLFEGLRKLGVSPGAANGVKSTSSSTRKTSRASAANVALPPRETATQAKPETSLNPAGESRWRTRLLAPISVIVVAIVVTVINRMIPPTGKSGVDAAPPAVKSDAWTESVRSPEWLAWRQKVHEKLAETPVAEADLKSKMSPELHDAIEKTVAEAFRIPMPYAADRQANAVPAAIMRRDQAVADVLMSYASVRYVLSKRFGIYETFLGTGLSNPVASDSYAGASIHEYLVPNESETKANVWTWQIKEPGIAPIMQKRVRHLIEGDPQTKFAPVAPTNAATLEKNGVDFPEYLKTVIMPKINDRNAASLQPVIRFKKLTNEKYSKRLGRPEAHRVFASNLAEVWDMKLEDAAKLSGYYNDESDTFFIWIYVPLHEDDLVQATWRQVLTRVPGWMTEIREKK